jgi:succinyl-CoA synthetase beta subunit
VRSVIACAVGGTSIEDLAHSNPEAIIKVPVDMQVTQPRHATARTHARTHGTHAPHATTPPHATSRLLAALHGTSWHANT